MEKKKIKLAITQGDINGVGYEVIMKTLVDNHILDICTPIIYGSTKAAAFQRKMLDIQSFNVNVISNASESHFKKINIINCGDDEVKVEVGQSTKLAGEASFLSLEAAVRDLKNGEVDVLLTAPMNPSNIDKEKFNFPGQIDYLEQVFGTTGDAMMMLVNDVLKVAILTGHTALSNVPSLITEELIVDKVTALNQSLLEDFGIRKPRIAVLGLNPHVGVDSTLGKEETEIIVPALKKLEEKGIVCIGPLSADDVFSSGSYSRFDAVLAMYYDQGAVPFKSIAMQRGVNYTAGLPIVRTAPIHGTDYAIAGQNIASEESFRQALFMACDIFNNRNSYYEISANPLKSESKQKLNPRNN